MNSFNKDELFFQLNNNECNENNKKKIIRKQTTNGQNKFLMNMDVPSPTNKKKLNKSITKFTRRRKSKLKNMSVNEGNVLNDYLHSHKFGIQRKKTRRITVKNQKNSNKLLNLNMNKTFYNKNSGKDWMTVVYYQNDNNNENISNINKIVAFSKIEENPNLKIVETSIIQKLNSMRNNFQNESINNHDSFDYLFDNNFFNNAVKNNSFVNHQNLKKPLQKSNRSLDKSISKVKKKIKNSHSLFIGSNQQNSNNNSNLNISNHLSSNFANNSLYKTDLQHTCDRHSFEKIEKVELASTNAKLSKKSLNYENFATKSSKSLLINNEIKDKIRCLSRIKPLYDSFDDDESEKDEENSDNVIELNNYIIFFLDLFLLFSSVYCLIYIPIRMAQSECFCGVENIINVSLLYFSDILFIGDFCLGFFRAYYNFQFKIIKNNKRIILHYLKTDGIIDFIEAIPIFGFTKFICKIRKEDNYCFKYNMPNSFIFLKILTNLKIFKILKVRNKRKNVAYAYFFNLFSENYFFEKLFDNFLNFAFCILAFHFFVCLNIFLSKQTYPNWLIIHNSQDKSLIHNYIISSYSLIETLTTVGYGDVVCQSNMERIFQIFFLVVGVIAYSFLISSVGNLFKNDSQSSINHSNNMKILEEIRVDYPKMPYKLYNKIYNYIESRNMAEKKSDANILTNSLPFNLKNALLLIMYRADIKNLKIFKNCDNSNFIIEIISNIVPSTNKKSEFLVYEGEMIEDLIIIKDGRLSLEAAINMEDPQSSIRNYFNVNFEGITSEKELRKLREMPKENNTSQFIQSKKTADFDKAKTILNTAVKKQVNYLLNGGEEVSILDRTKLDNKQEIEKEKTMHATICDHLKHEPINNEKGNFKYLKILDIRKNENFGGLSIFMRRPSPLSIKVRSKFAELYLLPKKEVFSIAKNYSNIWKKIHKKDFHNMLSIKHQTFNILNKFIEMNGLGKISNKDISYYLYPWEINEKKNNIVKNNNENNKSYDNNILYFNRNSIEVCPSPINNKRNSNQIGTKYNLFSNKSLENGLTKNKDKEELPLQTETDFSHLLNLMANEKQKNKNLNTNSNYDISNNNIKSVNDNNNSNEEKESFESNFLINKQNTNCSDDKTLIIQKSSERVLSTLNNIFDEKKAEQIKEEMIKSRKKENRRKVFSFGKKTAEIFKNENYSIFLVRKSTNEYIELKNKNNCNLSEKSKIAISQKEIEGLNKYISFCQDNAFLSKIYEISSSEENSIHQFEKKDLSKEEVVSFSLNSIYQNINVHTKMEYSQNKNLQQKTLNYLTKLIDENNQSSSDLDQSSSFLNNVLTNDKKSNNLSIKLKKQLDSLNSNFISKKEDEFLSEKSNFKSETSKNKNKKSANNKQKNKNRLNLQNSLYSGCINLDFKENSKGFNSMKPKKIDFDNLKTKNNKASNFKNEKYTFKIETVSNEGYTDIENIDNINKKYLSQNFESEVIQNKNTNYLNLKHSRKNNSLFSDNISNNIKAIKNAKTEKKFNLSSFKRSNYSENKSQGKKGSIKRKYTKKLTRKKSKQKVKETSTFKNKNNQQYKKLKSEHKLSKAEPKLDEGGVRNSATYFAKEEKEDCIII